MYPDRPILQAMLDEFSDRLARRERAIIAHRLREPTPTLRETAKTFGMSHERIRQIVIQTMRRYEESENPDPLMRLPIRARNVALNAGCTTVAEIAARPMSTWLCSRNCGKKTISQLAELVGAHGMSLGGF